MAYKLFLTSVSGFDEDVFLHSNQLFFLNFSFTSFLPVKASYDLLMKSFIIHGNSFLLEYFFSLLHD